MGGEWFSVPVPGPAWGSVGLNRSQCAGCLPLRQSGNDDEGCRTGFLLLSPGRHHTRLFLKGPQAVSLLCDMQISSLSPSLA